MVWGIEGENDAGAVGGREPATWSKPPPFLVQAPTAPRNGNVVIGCRAPAQVGAFDTEIRGGIVRFALGHAVRRVA
jgi:hypothetical protein